MVVDNFKQLEKWLVFKPNDFYFLQIIKRKKENPDLEKSSVIIISYYITSIEKYRALENDIKTICEALNARAYININPRNSYSITCEAISTMSQRLKSLQTDSCYKVWDHCCGILPKDKKHGAWIVDVDDKSLVDDVKAIINKCRSALKSLETEGLYDNCLDIIPTVNGAHIITYRFDVSTFTHLIDEYMNLHNLPKDTIELKEDNPTLLYYNSNSLKK